MTWWKRPADLLVKLGGFVIDLAAYRFDLRFIHYSLCFLA